jgi:hypothetical protein
MDQAPLVIDEIEAGKEFIKRLHAYRPVKAACWLRSAEAGPRYLYVALEGLTENTTDAAYGEVLRIAEEMKDDYYIDPFRVKLIRTSDPIAKAIVEIYRRFPGRTPPRSPGPVLGGVPVAEAYIYPPLPAKP